VNKVANTPAERLGWRVALSDLQLYGPKDYPSPQWRRVAAPGPTHGQDRGERLRYRPILPISRRAHKVETERGQQRDIPAIVLRYGFYHSLAWRRTPAAARQSQIDSRLINELQTFQRPLTRLSSILSAQLHDPRRVTFFGIWRLFLRGRFKRFSSRHVVIGTTLGPLSAATCSQSSASVRSGCLTTAARIFDSSFFKLRSRPPACGKASQLPVLRHLRQSFRQMKD
jgi:hypothetical protein